MVKTSKLYNYVCATCGGNVLKTPVETKPTRANLEDRNSYNGLHGWKCAKCGPGVKVLRDLKK